MKNRLKRKKVNVIERKDGVVEIYYQGKLLKSVLACKVIGEKQVLDYKEKNLWKPKKQNSKKDHPWKKYGYQIRLANEIRKRERSMV